MTEINTLNEIWYTKDHLTVSVLNFLKEKGYKAYKEESDLSGMPETILFVFGHGQKEIIEIKGYADNRENSPRQQLLKVARADGSGFWFPDALFSSLISLVNQYKNVKLPVSLCLPDLLRYREIIEKVEDYFTDNNLHHKIYLVSEDRKVTMLNLNRREEVTHKQFIDNQDTEKIV